MLLPFLVMGAGLLGNGDPVTIAVTEDVLLTVDPSSGVYSVADNGTRWLDGPAPRIAGVATSLHLVPSSVTRTSGSDLQGSFDAVSLEWTNAPTDPSPDRGAGETGGTVRVLTEWAVYRGDGSLFAPAIRFTQRYPDGVSNASAAVPHPATATLSTAFVGFPAFTLNRSTADLNALSFGGCQIQASGASKWASFHGGGGQQSMPLVLHDVNLHSMAIGPLDNFFVAVHETGSSPGVLAAGPMATLDHIPPGHSFSTLLVIGHGPNSTLYDWGTRLLANTGKARLGPEKSFVLSHLGYWVDNGAPYYHSTMGYNISEHMGCLAHGVRNCTQEDALKAVQSAADDDNIPLRYYQWDDWAPLDWNWPPRAFPDGASHWLGPDPHLPSRPMPLSLYHGLWPAPPSVKAPFKWSADGAVPLDPAFFAGIFKNGSKAGMVMFEQDYICDSTRTTSTDVDTGPTWFRALDTAAAAADIDVQLCMMNPAHALASTYMTRASNGRGTGDHVVRNAQRGLVLSTSSMLLWSVGLWPSRDNVWTNSTVVVPKMNPERTPVLQTIMAVLAGGPYGPSDIAGAMNKSLVLRSCRADGVLLRTDKPATVLDAAWAAAFDDLTPRHVNGAFTQIGSFRWSYVHGINLGAPFDVTSVDLCPECGVETYIACEFGTGCMKGPYFEVTDRGGLTLPARPQVDDLTPGWSYFIVAPVFESGWVLMGETSKIVPVSRRRFFNVTTPSEDLEVKVAAAPGEVVSVTTLAPNDRSTPIVTTCSGEAIGMGPVHSSNHFGDVDVVLTLTCGKDGCTCR